MALNISAYLPPFLRPGGGRPLVSVVRMSGVIGRLGPMRSGLSLSGLAPSIERAFKQRGAEAVALLINSPGGSPVQSSLIARRVRALAEEKEIPVYAFIEDLGASGGYWLACAADEIYADESSIVGSIGVITAGFGLDEAIKRFGVERRVYTSGERKSMLDPFRPENSKDVEHLKSIQADMHENFKRLVRERRGDKLASPEEELFNGAFWTGRQALERGLIDGIGDMRATLRARFGDKTRFRLFEAKKPFFKRRLGFAGPSGGEWAAAALAAVEERLMWSRFGL